MAFEMHGARRCALCQFDVDLCEKLVNRLSCPMLHIQGLTCGQVPVQEQPVSDTSRSPLEQILLSDTDCPELDYPCHTFCRETVEPACLQALLRVTKHSHTTTEAEERRRRLWLRNCLISELQAYHAVQEACRVRTLSSDVWYLIADLLLPHYALLKTRGALPDPDAISIETITTADKMWYDFTDYEGTSYVSRLSNSPKEHGSLSLTLNANRAPDCLLTAENHLGIKDIQFTDFHESKAINEQPGTWWRTIPLNPLGTKVNVETDIGYSLTGVVFFSSAP